MLKFQTYASANCSYIFNSLCSDVEFCAQAVYKGRKKKTIEYFAIKSVEKCHKSKVLQEVRL